MHVQDTTHWASATATAAVVSDGGGRAVHAAGVASAGVAGPVVAGAGVASAGNGRADARTTPLRVDAQRNLEHVLRAAREVFGELGYGAPMEDVARRARVGVGTVYRRFPSKDVLVRRIAEEETARLTDQARAALGQEDEPWSALSRFLRTSVASGAGRLLPPQVLRVGVAEAEPEVGAEAGAGAAEEARVPAQRSQSGASGPAELRLVPEPSVLGAELGAEGEDSGVAALLDVVGQLVDRARGAGALRADVSVADVLLVIATAAPSLPDAAQQAAASGRLLDILLEGLRSRPA
jgi:AcrR family transcriptional regulator